MRWYWGLYVAGIGAAAAVTGDLFLLVLIGPPLLMLSLISPEQRAEILGRGR